MIINRVNRKKVKWNKLILKSVKEKKTKNTFLNAVFDYIFGKLVNSEVVKRFQSLEVKKCIKYLYEIRKVNA